MGVEQESIKEKKILQAKETLDDTSFSKDGPSVTGKAGYCAHAILQR